MPLTANEFQIKKKNMVCALVHKNIKCKIRKIDRGIKKTQMNKMAH